MGVYNSNAASNRALFQVDLRCWFWQVQYQDDPIIAGNILSTPHLRRRHNLSLNGYSPDRIVLQNIRNHPGHSNLSVPAQSPLLNLAGMDVMSGGRSALYDRCPQEGVHVSDAFPQDL